MSLFLDTTHEGDSHPCSGTSVINPSCPASDCIYVLVQAESNFIAGSRKMYGDIRRGEKNVAVFFWSSEKGYEKDWIANKTQKPKTLMHAPVYEIRCVQAGIIVTLFQFALIYLFLTLGKQVKTHWLCCSPTSATADDSQGSLYLIQLLQELPELLQRHP